MRLQIKDISSGRSLGWVCKTGCEVQSSPYCQRDVFSAKIVILRRSLCRVKKMVLSFLKSGETRKRTTGNGQG